MRRGLAWLALLCLATPAPAQELVPSPPLAPGVAALPRLAGPGDAVASVNAALTLLDARDLAEVHCYDVTKSEGAARSVEVLSDGPEFLSLVISAGSYCDGAAHPWWSQRIVNFDLRSGRETDLRAFLPGSWQSAARPEDALYSLFLSSVGELPGDCVDSYAGVAADGYLSFDLGLDEASRTLVLWPKGLAYIDSPCLAEAFVPLDQLIEAGFDARIATALAGTN